LVWSVVVTTLALLAGCASPPPAAPPRAVEAPPAPAETAPPVVVQPAPAPEPPFSGKVSLAASERDYRRDGAQHLYERYGDRIFRGKLPPLLQAVGVMRLDIGPRGEVRRFEWMRAPDHVPHVKAEIERLVMAAAPFPAPKRLGTVSYTDTWLWDRSGTFQLDTLTEGQLDRYPAPAPKPAAAAPEPATSQPKTATSRSSTKARTATRSTRKPQANADTQVAQGQDGAPQLPR
jgi:hypothetical protein